MAAKRGSGQLGLICMENKVWRGKSQGVTASQRGSPGSWCRLEGLGSGEEANFFYLAEQRPE